MLKLTSCIVALLFITPTFGASHLMANTSYQNNPISSLNWTTDYQAALKQGAEENKTIFLFFTGSDWCTWCHRLEQEVLDKQEFANLTQDKFIFVKVDFPRKTKLSPELRTQNELLQRKFSIQGYPTVILIDSQEKVLANTGYQAGGPEKYASYLDAFSPKVNLDSVEALNHYELAVADFELNAVQLEKGTLSPALAIEPLVKYLDQHGLEQDVWRVEATIAEVYVSHDQLAEALKWANSALEHAPADVKDALEKMVAQIKSESQGDIAEK